MKIYLAGPMRGYILHNFPEFTVATARIREQGHEVFSPAEYDLGKGFDPARTVEEQGFNVRKALKKDLDWITDYADAIVVLHGWRHSRGATAEVCTAKALDLPVYELERFLLGDYYEVEMET